MADTELRLQTQLCQDSYFQYIIYLSVRLAIKNVIEWSKDSDKIEYLLHFYEIHGIDFRTIYA